MEILNSIFNWAMSKRLHQMELFMKYPFNVQEELFSKLLSNAEQTEIGKQYDFASISNLEQYRQRVPVQEYDDVKHHIARMQAGEQNVLWPGGVKWFAKSSGTTTDKSKYLPMTKDAIEDCHFKAGKDMLAIYCRNYPEHKLFAGRNFSLAGSWQTKQADNDNTVYAGDLSSILTEHLPIWVELKRTPRKPIALLEEFEEKVDRIVKIISKQDVRSITGTPSWMLVLLNRMLDYTGKSNVLEVWPDLELFMHGGVGFEPYRAVYEQVIPSDQMHYLNIYNASEGFFGIQDQRDTDDLLLMLDYGIFYEFMPLSEVGSEFPNTIGLDEVEIGVPYALVISTNGGLWRYNLGDVVEFCSRDPFRIRITGRTRQFINAFGEELMVRNAEDALVVACDKTGAIVKEYTAGPVYAEESGQGGHEWLVEFERPPESLEYFLETLDNALKSLNSDYEAKRYKNMTLRPPVMHIMPEGTFYKWMKSRGKVGGQNKVPRLSNSREYLDSILEEYGNSAASKSFSA